MARRKMVEVEDLVIGHGGIPLLEAVDFRVWQGDIFLILGGSGCGKSTLLRHLIGLTQPMAGRIHVHAVGRPGFRPERPAFGVLFQSGALFGSMTLAQNVALPLQKWTRLPAAAIEAVVRAKLALVGLSGFENHLPSEISGGMKKRAGIARALALDPPLLFLDEPGAGLDPVTARELDELILSLREHLGLTAVIVTHELASIFHIGDECILLDPTCRGILAHGCPRDLLRENRDPRVQRFLRRGQRSDASDLRSEHIAHPVLAESP